MTTIARRRALSSGHPSTEWKRGALARPIGTIGKERAMENDLLATFFARYPSALGSTHAGGQYRIICPECGHIVPVAVLDESTDHLSVRCDNCGYADELTSPSASVVNNAA